MKSVTYGPQQFVTADEVADALLHLLANLKPTDAGEVITVPTYDTDGREGSLSIVMAAGIPMTTRPAVSKMDEPDVVEVLAGLRGASGRGEATPQPLDSPPGAPLEESFDPREGV